MSTQDLSLDSVSNLTHSQFENNRAEIEKSARERVIHDENHKFAPGNCANPAGRPPNVVSPTAAYKQILAEKGATELAEVVYNDALTARRARDRLAAASEITDRVDGKATQRVDMRGLVVMMPAEAAMDALDSWAGDDE